jgi:hypothetical protein
MRKQIAIASLVVASLCVVGVASASVFEWFVSGSLHNLTRSTSSLWPSPMSQMAYGGDIMKVKYKLQTSAPYSESRSVYVVSTTSTGQVYVEIPSCRYTSVVSGVIDAGCTFTMNTSGGNSHTLRVTTNYTGCNGFTYTPTPSTGCGDIMDYPITQF